MSVLTEELGTVDTHHIPQSLNGVLNVDLRSQAIFVRANSDGSGEGECIFASQGY